jgi:hypothetical protein
MNEMIERVAKALYDNMCLANPHVSMPFAGAKEDVRRFYSEQARTAIHAMRNPTKDMIVAAMVEPVPSVQEAGGIIPQGEQATLLQWQAMIDAIGVTRR